MNELDNLKQRLIRVETKLCKLMEFLGMTQDEIVHPLQEGQQS